MSNELQIQEGATRYEFDGKRMTIYEWARYLTQEWGVQVSHTALLNRLSRGWTVEQVLSTPIGERRPRPIR